VPQGNPPEADYSALAAFSLLLQQDSRPRALGGRNVAVRAHLPAVRTPDDHDLHGRHRGALYQFVDNKSHREGLLSPPEMEVKTLGNYQLQGITGEGS
jgi:hypothetical protein